MGRAPADWAVVLERVLENDPLAVLQTSRLLNSFLDRWGAYDFMGDWDDLIQETIIASARAVKEGKLRDRGAAFGYLKSTLRFKFVDRVKLAIKQRGEGTVAIEDASETLVDEDAPNETLRRDLREALDGLPANQRAAVETVHLQGCTYDEAAERTGIPLGSLKRHLRDGLATLRARLEDADRPP